MLHSLQSVAASAIRGIDQMDMLEHLTGIRSLLALWIVCGHYMPAASTLGILQAATCRSFTAVDVFIVMSGFVTQWSYGKRLRSGQLSIGRFYIRRLSYTVVTTYVAMVVSILVVLAVPAYRSSFMPSAWTIFSCFTFVAHWIRPSTWCPAPPSWTIEALIPSWLLYPFLRELVERVDAKHGRCALLMTTVLVHLVSFGPLYALYIQQGQQLTWGQYATGFMWPPAQLGDFAIGVITAFCCQKEDDQKRDEGWSAVAKAVLADLSLLLCAGLVLLLPVPLTHAECETNSNALLTHALALPIALFMYGSRKGGLGAYFLSHKALVSLGKYSFEVYLFQWPLLAIFRQLCQQWPLAPDTFMAFLLLLWLVAGLYVEAIAPVITDVVRSFSA